MFPFVTVVECPETKMLEDRADAGLLGDHGNDANSSAADSTPPTSTA